MRKLVLFMHVSLDLFAAGPNGEMDWIHVDEELFDYAGRRTREADIALYGRVTYEMMEAYWPSAGSQPEASKHDIEHSAWYNSVDKVVLSRTLRGIAPPKTTIISDHVPEAIGNLKNAEGKDILIFGSPTAAHALMKENLIDDYWLFVNPVLLGQGIPLFKDIRDRQTLRLVDNIVFDSGVVCLHYEKA